MLLKNKSLDRWLLTQAVVWAGLLPTLAVWVHLDAPRLQTLLVFGGVMFLSYLLLVPALGAGRSVADGVTLIRFAVLFACTGIAWLNGTISWVLWIGIGVALLADLLDGYCARRFGGSPAGAMLDMETDQMATLCLALLLFVCVGVGAWVLLLPGFRYLYLLWMKAMRIPAADPKPCDDDNTRAKWICALMMILLFVALCPALPQVAAIAAAALSVAMLAYSYGSDVRFHLQRRREAAAK